MKRVFIPAMMLAMALTNGPLLGIRSVSAHDESDEKAKRSIRAVIIDADGKKQEIAIDDDGKKDLTKTLPKEVQEQLKKSLPDDVLKKLKEALQVESNKGKATANIFGKGIIIGPDGKKREFGFGDDNDGFKSMFKNFPPDVRERLERAMKAHKSRSPSDSDSKSSAQAKSQFSVKGVIIGPDGERKEFQFGDESDDPKRLQAFPKDVRNQVEEALRQFDLQLRLDGKSRKAGQRPDRIEEKLDLILKRLDRMDKELQELKKKVD